MKRPPFSPAQRLVLTGMAIAVIVVFGLLAYSVITTLQRMSVSPVSPLPTPLAVSSLVTPSVITPTLTATPPLTPTVAPAPTRPIPLSQIQSARAVREVARIVAEVRQLPPVVQIPVTFLTEHEAAVFLLQQYQEERPQEALTLYAALGLMPRLSPLPLPDVAAQARHISSLYLSTGRQIIWVTGRGLATPEDELGLVHALAHALQDQAFGVESLTPCRPTTDAALALKALLEGDIVWTEAVYAGVLSDEEEWDRLARMASDAEEPTYGSLVDSPLFERLRLFPYRQGAALVAALYTHGGWETVDRAYGRPPCSTEQVLHPERYLSQEPVQRVAVPDLGPVLGEGWKRVREDTLGELPLGLHLAACLENDGLAWQGADGWAGDTFVLWEGQQGQEVMVWRIAWDSRDEAAAFVRTYSLLVPCFRTPPLLATKPPFGLPGQYWEGPAGAAYVVRAGRVVTVVWGPDPGTVTAVAQALP